MPNHVSHVFTITGESENIQNFISRCISKDGEFNFSSLVTKPEILDRTISGITNEMQTAEYKAIEKEAIETTGFNNWYNWCIENWGTKWNAYNTFYDHNDDFIQFEFDTAWSCPEPIFNALAKQYPTMKFHGYAIDEGYGFGAEITIEDGSANVEYFDVNAGFMSAFSYRFD